MADFHHTLFGCFDNCTLCVCTYFCPCYMAGKVAQKVGGSCVLCGLVLFVPILNVICMGKIRGKIREQKGISGGTCNDLLTVLFCSCCAIVQEAQEVDAFGSMAQSIARE